MFDKKIKCYVARAMSNRVKEEIVAEATRDKALLEAVGFEVLCPVIAENVAATKEILKSSKKAMDVYWARDKEMIREAHVVFNMSPHWPSLGVIREHGYARYHLWKKVLSVFPEGKLPMKAAVCHYEDDFVTDNLTAAAEDALRTHGTYFKRLKWRISIYRKSWLRSLFNRAKEWFR